MAHDRPSILIVSGASLSVHGGRERWTLEVAKKLRNICPTTIISLVETDHQRVTPYRHRLKLIQSEISKYGIQYHEIKTISINLKPIKRVPLSLRKLIRAILDHEVIYVAGDVFLGVLFSLLAFLLGKRGSILGLHVSPSERRLRYALPFLKILNGTRVIRTIHVVNIVDFVVLKYSARLKVTYIPNFVDCTKFRPTATKRDDSFQVLYVGALALKKGIDVVLKVSEHIKREIPEANLVIVSYGGVWEERVMEYARKGLVYYKGFVTDEELMRLYSESHVLVMPSREEPFGLVALEAQACGTPVITPNLPSFRLTVKDGVTGFRVKSYEVNEWIESLRKIYALWKYNKQAYTLMCNGARNHVCRNFYLNVIRNIIELFLSRDAMIKINIVR